MADPAIRIAASPGFVIRRKSRRLGDLLGHPVALASILILIAVTLVAILAPFVAPYDPLDQQLDSRLAPPIWAGGSLGHPFGTDQLGRDVLTRLMYGARISLAIGIMAVLVSGVLGVVAGVVAGFYSGWVDEAIMRLADLRLALPFILLVISVIAVFGPSFTNLIVILGLTGWVPYAKVVRAETLSIREREFMLAARAVGAGNVRLMFRHVLPNTIASAIVIGSLELANVIVVEASLSFLGLGVQPPTPSWGNMLGESRDYLMSNFWLATLPGIAISVTAISVNLVGDWLRDVLDPRTQA